MCHPVDAANPFRYKEEISFSKLAVAHQAHCVSGYLSSFNVFQLFVRFRWQCEGLNYFIMANLKKFRILWQTVLHYLTVISLRIEVAKKNIDIVCFFFHASDLCMRLK